MNKIISNFRNENFFGKYEMLTTCVMMPISGLIIGSENASKNLQLYKKYEPFYNKDLGNFTMTTVLVSTSFLGGFLLGYMSGIIWPVTGFLYCYDKYTKYKANRS
jgi:hypothetical protein